MTTDSLPLTELRSLADTALPRDPIAARALATRLCAYREADASDWLRLAAAHAALGAWDESSTCAECAASLAPTEIRAWWMLADIACAIGKDKDAGKYLERAVASDSGSAAAYLRLGRWHAEGGRFEDAAHQFRSALRLDPRHPEALASLGHAQLALNVHSEAVSCFEHALQADPQQRGAFVGLGDACFALGNFRRAINCYQGALRLDAQDTVTAFKLARAFHAAGNLDAAEIAALEALRIDPGNVRPYELLALLAETRGRPPDEATAIREAARHVLLSSSRDSAGGARGGGTGTLTTEKVLYLRLYLAGMSNMRMSLEIGVALAHLTGRVLVPYHARAVDTGHSPHLEFGRDFTRYATLLDLLDLPVQVRDDLRCEKKPAIRGARPLPRHAGRIMDSMLFLPETLDLDAHWVCDFRNDRDPALMATLDEHDRNLPALHVSCDTLGYYSYHFCLAPSDRAALNRVMAHVDVKSAYRVLADRIANDFGRFNCVHLRRGDFVQKGFTPRAQAVTAQEIVLNLATVCDTDVPLLICTDRPYDAAFHAAFRSHFRRVEILDRILMEHAPYREAVRALPFHDNAVISLLSQRIAEQAAVFVGTLYSSFSAIVQRRRGIIGKDRRFLFCFDDFGGRIPDERCEFRETRGGTFSWNRLALPLAPKHLSWCREWPEAFEGVGDQYTASR